MKDLDKYLWAIPHVALALITLIYLLYRHGLVPVLEVSVGAAAIYFLLFLMKLTLKNK